MQKPLKILQWNACSLNYEKRAQLELLVAEEGYEVLCISELGRYRKLHGFQHYDFSNADTQSVIFWRDGLKVKKIQTEFDSNNERILTQCININNELLLIHTYIAPELNHRARSKYRQELQIFLEQLCNENSI